MHFACTLIALLLDYGQYFGEGLKTLKLQGITEFQGYRIATKNKAKNQKM
jgi:hypothetical protein